MKTFRYVLHDEVPAFAADGWVAHDSLNGTHHGEYSTLMEYRGETAPKADRGVVQPWAPHHAPLRTRRDLNLFVQRAIDILCIAFLCAFVNLTGLAVAYAVYVCLFERVS